MRTFPALLSFVLTFTVTAACSKAAAPTAPTPAPAPTTPTTVVPVLTLEQDTGSPVGQAVAITYASQMQEAGKITIAVSGFNLSNVVNARQAIIGVASVEGRLKYDDAVLDIERTAAGVMAGDFMRLPGQPVSCCRSNYPVAPGLYPFFVGRDGPPAQGSGELFLARFQPRAGVTSATTRIELVPFNVSEAAGPRYTFVTPLLMGPYSQDRGNLIENAYGATITIRPGS